MGNRYNARLTERAWVYATQINEPIRTDLLQEYLRVTYDHFYKQSNMTQALLASGLFRRHGWCDRNTDEIWETEMSGKALGLKDAKWVCVIKPIALDEVVAKFVGNNHTARRLDKMPSFVQRAVAEARGEA